MKLDNATYNKIKLLHELSCIAWFIEKHALADAQATGDKECQELLGSLGKDLQTYIEKLQKSICMVIQ